MLHCRYYDRRDAEDAMERLDGKQLDGREIRVSKAMHGRPDGTAGPPRRRDRFAFVLLYYVDLNQLHSFFMSKHTPGSCIM